MTNTMVNINKLGHEELMTYAKRLARYERKVQVEFLKTLAEIDRRRLYLKEGYPNLFRYLTDELKFSESCAAQRKNVCRAARKYPQLYGLLAQGQVSLTSIGKIACALLEQGRKDLIEKIIGKSSRDIELLLATNQPKHAASRDHIRIVGVMAKEEGGQDQEQGERELSMQPLATPDMLVSSHAQEPPLSKPQDRPVADEDVLVKVHFSTNQRVNKKLARAKELLARKHPDGRLNEIVEELLDFYLAKHDPLQQPVKAKKPARQQPLPKNASPAPAAKPSRRPSKQVQRFAMQRSGGQCEWRRSDGTRCQARRFLEYDHRLPYALGGESGVDNIRVLCSAHNKQAAREVFGKKPGLYAATTTSGVREGGPPR